jgi:hypothetical protein
MYEVETPPHLHSQDHYLLTLHVPPKPLLWTTMTILTKTMKTKASMICLTTPVNYKVLEKQQHHQPKYHCLHSPPTIRSHSQHCYSSESYQPNPRQKCYDHRPTSGPSQQNHIWPTWINPKCPSTIEGACQIWQTAPL